MSKPKIKIVIGANYGDEGKGLATDYFTRRASGSVLNVLYNGGPQRGHTVEHKNGLRHIFHHFGSGFFSGALTYFDEAFLVDPIKFNIEHCELLDQARYFTDMTEENAIVHTICYANPNCRVITPWDAMANQILQKDHNTCGCGIWQTIQRYSNAPFATTLKGMCDMDDAALKKYLKDISWYQLYQIGKDFDAIPMEHINTVLGEYKDVWFNDNLINNFIYDIRQMSKRIVFADLSSIADYFDTFIFEGGQGLAIGNQNGRDQCNELTPSNTGSIVPVCQCNDISDDIEICYVTRSYVTRHGIGNLPFERNKDELEIDEIDITNQPNKFQGTLRYARLYEHDLLKRIDKDYSNSQAISMTTSITKSLMITHANSKRFSLSPNAVLKFDNIYETKTPYSKDMVIKVNTAW